MKKHFVFAIFSIFAVGILNSCSDDDDSSNSNNNSDLIVQLETSIKTGAWRVSRFIEDDDDQTHHFNGYAFTFGENGTVIASNGTNTVTGNWVSSSSSNNPKFIITFNAADGPFEEISEDWRIESVTSTVVELKHMSGGDGSIDLLTFSKI